MEIKILKKLIINRAAMHSKYQLIIVTLLTLFFIEYRLVRKLGEGTFSEVLKAESVKTR
jgi:serine/threonine protein kinase